MISNTTIQTITKWRRTVLTKDWVNNQVLKISERQIWMKNHPLPKRAFKELEKYYNDGNGFKTIAKELGISYTETRGLLIRWLSIPTRKGMNVITDALRDKRRINALGEKSNFYNWVERRPDMAKKQTKSIQGWYENRKHEKVWLRSSLEYIYAKWLDESKIDWKPEVQTYKGDGESYRPDFFIYEKGNLKEVVEVKGNYFDNVDSRSEKAIRVCKKNNVKLVLIRDIKPYLPQGSFYHKELKQWKELQKQYKEKSNELEKLTAE